MIKTRVETEKILFEKENAYTVAPVKIKEQPKDTEIPTTTSVIRGYFPAIHLKDGFEIGCRWSKNEKWGWQLEVKTHAIVLPETSKGMIRFLSNLVKGVGKITATKIVNEFKEDTFKIIQNKPEKLATIKGISREKAEILSKGMDKVLGLEAVALLLTSKELSHTQAMEIYECLGYSAIYKVEKIHIA